MHLLIFGYNVRRCGKWLEVSGLLLFPSRNLRMRTIRCRVFLEALSFQRWCVASDISGPASRPDGYAILADMHRQLLPGIGLEVDSLNHRDYSRLYACSTLRGKS